MGRIPHAIAACIALGGAALLLWATSRHGLGVSNDSVGYLAMARHVAAGEGWLGWYGAPAVLFPPGLSAVLALFELGGADLLSCARYLNAFCLAATIWLATAWLRAHLLSQAVAWISALALAFSGALLLAMGYLWTEPLFILLMILALMDAQRYWRDGSNAALLRFALFSGLAFSVRYAGVALLFTGLLVIALRPGMRPARWLRDGFWFGAVGSSLTVLWLARNWILADTGFGLSNRPDAVLTPLETLLRGAGIIGHWFWPRGIGVSMVSNVAALLLGMATLLVVAAFVRHGRKRLPARNSPMLPLAAFALIYVGFIVLVKMRVGNLEPRYLTPALVPITLLIARAVDHAMSTWNACGTPWLGRLTVAAFAGWVAFQPIAGTMAFAAFSQGVGLPGYTDIRWKRTHAFDMLKDIPEEAVLYSNAGAAAYFVSGVTTHPLPRAVEWNASLWRDAVQRHLAETRPVLVVYLRSPWMPGWNAGYVGPDELAGAVQLKHLWAAQDGTGSVYQVVAPEPGTDTGHAR